MIWLTWRQHRGEFVGAAVLVAVLGVLLLTHGISMHQAYDRDGVAACQLLVFGGGDGGSGESCAATVQRFETTHLRLPEQFATWLPFLPMVAGMLIGAPLFAREYEQGTWQLAWTQGVTRTRWVVTKLALVLGGVLAVSVALAAGVSWWFGPMAPHRFIPERFNHAVLVFPAYVMVSVAIGILAGAIVRRTIVAAAIVIPAYLALRIPIEFLLRPRYRDPLTSADPAWASGGWIVTDGQPAAGPVGGPPARPTDFEFHPAGRFWEFQLIETAILAGITFLLLVASWRLVRGRRTHAVAATAEQTWLHVQPLTAETRQR